MSKPQIAIIGSGISGLTCLWQLQQDFDITLYEKNQYFGGHTDTHNITVEGQNIAVDTGFIVFNEMNYPHFCKMIEELDIAYQPTDMSFSSSNLASGFEYGFGKGSQLLKNASLFFNGHFRRLFKDLLRFYKQASALDLEHLSTDITLEQYAADSKLSQAFTEDHLYPMAGALWSMTTEEVPKIPLLFVLSFFANHHMLQITGRPAWQTVSGGSNAYIKALRDSSKNTHWKNEAVIAVEGSETGPQSVITATGSHDYDAVIFACHPDQALDLIQQPSNHEQRILSQFEYTDNHMLLHSDKAAMPKKTSFWSSWNVLIGENEQAEKQYSISYWMNLLQTLPVKTPIITTLNPVTDIDPNQVYLERHYRHPKYTIASYQAQQDWPLINQFNRFFCGAYWGWGFHEDGAKSAHRVIENIRSSFAS